MRKLEKVRDFLPPQDPRFKVIITTRNEQIARNFHPINLEVLSPDAAVELLAVFLPDAVKSNPEKAKELVKWLGYLPLGIELVGRYGQYMNCGLAELLEQLQAQRLKDESLLVPENTFMTAQRGVAAAFELSWRELSATSQLAGEWISLFAESGINEDLILALFENRSPQPPLKSGAIERVFPTFFKWFSKPKAEPIPELNLSIPTRADLRHLVNLSLLTDVGNNNYELHTLIRIYLRKKLEASPLKEEAKRAYGRVMVGIAKTIDQTLTLEDIAKLEPYIEHLKVVAEEFHQCLAGEDLTLPFYGLSTFYRAQGLYQQAVPYVERSLTLSEQCFGKNHPEVATDLNNLADLYESQGKYAEAEPLYLRSLAIKEKNLGEDHPSIAISFNNLALLYKTQGKYAEAEPLYLRSLEILEKQLGAEHPDVASSLNNLALLYKTQGKYAEAEPLYQKAIAILLATLGENHPNTQTVIMNYYLMLAQLRDDELNQRFPPETVEYIQSFRHT